MSKKQSLVEEISDFELNYPFWEDYSEEWIPNTDLFETQNSFYIKMEIAGVDPAKVNISLEEGQVIVEGKREEEDKRIFKKSYHQAEIDYSHFSRVIDLPKKFFSSKINAYYENGILTIKLRKAKNDRLKFR